MKSHTKISLLLSVILTVTLPGIASAGSNGVDFGGKTGVEYDSNLSVQELDKMSSEGDMASVLDLFIVGHVKPTERFSLKSGYSYSSKSYRQNDDFDQRNHTLHIDGSYDFDGLKVGASYYYVQANLASERFLSMNIASLYVGKMLTKSIYLRHSVNTTDKEFSENNGRDAQSISLNGDLFFFYNNANSFLSLGLSGEKDAAMDVLYSNESMVLRAALSNSFSLLGKKNKTEIGLRYTDKDYEGFDSDLAAQRRDQRLAVKASWDITLARFLSLGMSIEYGNYNSNKVAADYNNLLGSVLLKADF